MPTPSDVVLYSTGATFGVAVAFGALMWLWLRSCEKYSERGFGDA